MKTYEWSYRKGQTNNITIHKRSWLPWGMSTHCHLLSFFLSINRSNLRDRDGCDNEEKIFTQKKTPGYPGSLNHHWGSCWSRLYEKNMYFVTFQITFITCFHFIYSFIFIFIIYCLKPSNYATVTPKRVSPLQPVGLHTSLMFHKRCKCFISYIYLFKLLNRYPHDASPFP